MSVGYRLAYRLGPHSRGTRRPRGGSTQSTGLLAARGGWTASAPLGRALDLGCGSGQPHRRAGPRPRLGGRRPRQLSPRARCRPAREPARQPSAARFVVGDVTQPDAGTVLAGPGRLLPRRRLLPRARRRPARRHGTRGHQRSRHPGATLLLLAFRPQPSARSSPAVPTRPLSPGPSPGWKLIARGPGRHHRYAEAVEST